MLIITTGHHSLKGLNLSQIFTVTEGQGLPIVALHGWGMNHRVWQPIRPALTDLGQVTWLDLPGHGYSRSVPLIDLADTVQQLSPLIPDGAILMGWSLGGMVAQALARALPERIQGLILIASTPRFVQDAAWPYGLEDQVLAQFALDLQKDYEATVKRFFALQLLGTKVDPQAIQTLRDAILALPADPQALQAGLAILRYADQRDFVFQPSLWLLGRLDKLIPVRLAQGLVTMGYPITSITILDKAP